MLTKTRFEQYHENGFVPPTTPRSVSACSRHFVLGGAPVRLGDLLGGS